MKTETYIPLGLLLLLGCQGGGSSGVSPSIPPTPTPTDAVITIDNRAGTYAVAPPVNRRLLGSNLQWTDSGDGVVSADGVTFAPGPLQAAKALAPTVLRYPGGGQADVYHWQDGIPGLGSDLELNVFTGTTQPIHFGTDAFLAFCDQTAAQPMITVNIVTGTPAESVSWIQHTNGSDRSGLPRVKDWEIGNEPYYTHNSHPEWDLTASQFASNYNAHVAAMIAEDTRIRVGLPLLGPLDGALLAADRRTWNADVLSAIHQRVDFVAVHNAYLPFYYKMDRIPSDGEMLPAILAGAAAVNADLDTLRAQLSNRGITAPFAMTEFNALVTTFATFSPIPRSDGAIASMADAIYVADLICTLANRDDMDSAQHWSLIGNWFFGAMNTDGSARPAYRATQGLGKAMTGRRLPLTTQGPTADIAAFGALPAISKMPLVSAFACASGSEIRVVLINRSPDHAYRVRLECRGGASSGDSATLRTFDDGDPLALHYNDPNTPDWQTSAVPVDASGAALDLPAHALAIVNIPASM